MKRFAKVMEGAAALVVEALEAPVDGGRWIECGDASAGDRYDEAEGTFSRERQEDTVPTAGRPHIVITHIQPDEGNAATTTTTTLLASDWSEVTCREGTRLAVSAELRSGEAVLPLTAQFRLPLRATDGRERVLLATMTDGRISIGATLRDSGIWRVDEAGINSAMPSGQGFAFSGLTVYVLQD